MERKKRNETNPFVLIFGFAVLVAVVIAGYYFFNKISKSGQSKDNDKPADEKDKFPKGEESGGQSDQAEQGARIAKEIGREIRPFDVAPIQPERPAPPRAVVVAEQPLEYRKFTKDLRF